MPVRCYPRGYPELNFGAAISPKHLIFWSERRDLNSGPPVPQTGALTGLRYAPTGPLMYAGGGAGARSSRPTPGFPPSSLKLQCGGTGLTLKSCTIKQRAMDRQQCSTSLKECPALPLHVRMRAAQIALPFEKPALKATASIVVRDDLRSALRRRSSAA